ncbi:Hypothetical protein R9X50_00332800 [Acrodontium crateriforme]|uniref:Transcriptional co-activator n=1 Tax=Acrodontium crateriforme TaxID=150365 RepID=A0AAQ3M2R1_9PEZI|nr:Hypothetical protein R9X50_00332800 [Acrodontium crateriforme]
MNPADLTLPTLSPTLANKAAPSPLTLALKNGKSPVPRVDLEPVYTQLKAALGDQWTDYKAVVNGFVLGQLNHAELSWVLQPLLAPVTTGNNSIDVTKSTSSTLQLHNTLIAAIFANTLRDPPPVEVAPWVVATDKPSLSSKNAAASGANDKAEERLKRETMALHARDRRRIKTTKESANPVNDGFREMQEYKLDLSVKPPDPAPTMGGGLTKTNWDLEIRRRYAQQLAAETLEFPTQSEMQAKIEPICYEEGLAGGAQGSLPACAELVEQAMEVFLKEMLGHLCQHSRSNAEGSIQTSKFRRQFRKEENDAERGLIQRNAAGLLPVELEVRAKREPVTMDDLNLALQLSDPYLRHDPFLSENVALSRYADHNTVLPKVNGVSGMNGSLTKDEDAADDDAMAVDEVEYWKGSTHNDRDELMSVLDGCLAAG